MSQTENYQFLSYRKHILTQCIMVSIDISFPGKDVNKLVTQVKEPHVTQLLYFCCTFYKYLILLSPN